MTMIVLLTEGPTVTARAIAALRVGRDGCSDFPAAVGDIRHNVVGRDHRRHEPRTADPFAALAVNNEVIRNHPAPTVDDYEASLDRSDALIARLQLTIDELLQDARARTHETHQVDNDLMAIVYGCRTNTAASTPTSTFRSVVQALCYFDRRCEHREHAHQRRGERRRFSRPGKPIEVDVTRIRQRST